MKTNKCSTCKIKAYCGQIYYIGNKEENHCNHLQSFISCANEED